LRVAECSNFIEVISLNPEHRTQKAELSAWPHRLALVLCCATFPLVWVGGLVTSYKAGMAFPDWPTSGGHFLFFYPWLDWLRGPWDMFVEHGHRLLASLVGVLTIAVCVAAWRSFQPRSVRLLAVAALAGVILQGVLGGIRVLLNQETYAMIHGCVGPAFFALTAALAVVTSRSWQQAEPSGWIKSAPSLAVLALALPMLAYVQIVLGAQVRHFSPDSAPSLFRVLVLFHVVVGIALALYVIATTIVCSICARHVRSLIFTSAFLCMLLIVQVALGAATWIYKYNYPAFLANSSSATDFTVQAMDWRQAQITTAHVACGSLILAISTVFAIQAARYYGAGKIAFGHSSDSLRHDGNRMPSRRTFAEATA
jgi:cytochrome c oxidase assembly protein subunit 15